MKEISGNLWNFHGRPNHVVLVTTNGSVNRCNLAVMGRGCALEAAKRFPNLPKELGNLIRKKGNGLYWFPDYQLMTFPVKHEWYQKADLDLIFRSARQLRVYAEAQGDKRFVLPRPGCGNGRLNWREVRPKLEDLPDNVLVISPPDEQASELPLAAMLAIWGEAACMAATLGG